MTTKPSLSDNYERAEKLLDSILTRAAKHALPWERRQAKIERMRAILLSFAANYSACMRSLEEHAKI